MYFCPLCNTRYTAEQPCFCHPRYQADSRRLSAPERTESVESRNLTGQRNQLFAKTFGWFQTFGTRFFQAKAR